MKTTPNSAFQTTPLHKAAEDADVDLCLKLIKEGTDVNALDEIGWSPLIHAVSGGHVEVAKALIETGAKLHYEYQREDTAEAREKEAAQQKKMHEWTTTSEAYKEALSGLPEEIMAELSSGDMMDEMIQEMVDLHFEPDSKDVTEQCHHLEVLKLLVVDHGADINYVASDGTWPLANFAEKDHLEAVSWLLENGADPNTTSTGETAIFKAITNDNLDMVRLMVERGAKVDVEDVDGWSVLFACKSVEMAKFLIEQGVDPKATDQCGFPCFRWAYGEDTQAYLKEEATKRGLTEWTTMD